MAHTTLDTFEIEVGVTTTSYIQPTNAVYNPVTGQLTVIAPNHGLDVTSLSGFPPITHSYSLVIWIIMDLITLYPRSTDPISNTRIGIAPTSDNEFIVNVGVSTHTFSQAVGADYNATTGIMTVTTDKPHGLRALVHQLDSLLMDLSLPVVWTIIKQNILTQDQQIPLLLQVVYRFGTTANTFTC